MQFTSEAKESVPGLGQVEQPKRTFFYERPDGSIIFTNSEEEAVGLHKKFRQYGVSDGKKFFQAVAEAQELFKTVGLAGAQERIRRGELEERESAKGNIVIPRERKVLEPNGPTGFQPR